MLQFTDLFNIRAALHLCICNSPCLLFAFISTTLRNQTMCFITDVSAEGNTQPTGRTNVYISDLLGCVILSLSTRDQLQRKWQYEGKTTEINNISSHLLTCPGLIPNWSFSVHVACSTSHPTPQSALILVSSTRLWPSTHETDTSLCVARTQEAHTLPDLVSPSPFPSLEPILSCARNLGCVLEL